MCYHLSIVRSVVAQPPGWGLPALTTLVHYRYLPTPAFRSGRQPISWRGYCTWHTTQPNKALSVFIVTDWCIHTPTPASITIQCYMPFKCKTGCTCLFRYTNIRGIPVPYTVLYCTVLYCLHKVQTPDLVSSLWGWIYREVIAMVTQVHKPKDSLCFLSYNC